jgi:hypothetical protein
MNVKTVTIIVRLSTIPVSLGVLLEIRSVTASALKRGPIVIRFARPKLVVVEISHVLS